MIRACAVGYLRKPIDEQQVLAAIHVAHAGGAPLDASATADRIRLSSRERAIVRKLVEGGTFKGIASSLVLSPNTVDTHLRNIYAKLGVRSKSAAVAKVIREGLA